MNLKSTIICLIFSLALLGPFGPAGPLPTPAPAQAASVSGTGFAEETITVSTAAIGITSTLCLERGRQTPALLEVLTNAIYFTLNSPTATPDSSDHAAPVGTVISVNKANYVRMIRQSADSSVKVTCFRGGHLPTATSFDKSNAAAAGEATVNLGSVDNAVLDAIAASVAIIDAQVFGAGTKSTALRVTLPTDGTGQVGLNAGTLHADSPTTEVAILSLFDGSAETQILTTNLGASKAITITGSGRITKACLVSSLGSVLAEDGAVLFFDADPDINADTDDLTLAEAQFVTNVLDFVAADYLTNFAASAIACNTYTNESFHSITHVDYHLIGSTTLDDEDIELHLWYRRDS